MMNWDNLEEMPYHHLDETLTTIQLDEIKSYCKNDVMSTHLFYKYTIGEVEHESYKGKNKIQDRLDLIEEGLLGNEALNYSDSKIGDELNKKSYCKLTNKEPKDLYDLKKKRGATKSFTFGDAIPDYVQFKTKELQNFYDKVKKIKVSLKQGKSADQEFLINFKGTESSVARGGIHSTEKNRVIEPKEDEILRDADVGSQYPNAIVKRGLFPSHLGKEWLNNYRKTIQTRMEYKANSKDNRKYKGLSEMFKLALNGGGYGKTGENTNWQYDPRVMYFCTIGNQFELLLLCEMMELSGIHVVSQNTDGIICLFHKSLEDKYYQVCNEWEKIVGNDVMGKLEFTDFKGLYQESINHYIAIKTDGSVKVKGRFTTEDEIHKNNSDKISRIERKALVSYFVDKIPIEKTIRESSNIFDFLIGKKSSKDYQWETIDSNNKRTEYNKLIRFYISTNGEKLLKTKKKGSDAPGAEVTKFFDGNLVTIVNNIVHLDPNWKQYINYDYYINNIQQVVDKIELGRKRIITDKNQLNLF